MGKSYFPTRTSGLINFREGEAKTIKDVIIPKWKLLFFILDLRERDRFRGMHLKFKTSV